MPPKERARRTSAAQDDDEKRAPRCRSTALREKQRYSDHHVAPAVVRTALRPAVVACRRGPVRSRRLNETAANRGADLRTAVASGGDRRKATCASQPHDALARAWKDVWRTKLLPCPCKP